MYKLAIGIAFCLLLFNNTAMAACSVPNTLTNGTTADATAVMGNFTSLAGCAAPLAGPSFTGNASFAGSVGIGTSAPTATLDIGSANVAPASHGNLFLYDNTTTQTAGNGGQISLGGWLNGGSGAVYTYAAIRGVVESSVTNVNGGALVFYASNGTPSPTERMRITSTGSVGIGTNSPSYTLHVNGSVAGTSAYNNLSDARLKKNIVPLMAGLALLGQLQPVRFDWRSESERAVGKEFNLPAGKQVGFIAQDVGKVLPEAVSTAKGKDAIMSVAESKVVPVLVAAVKELKAANDNQSAEIGTLKDEVAILQRKLAVHTAQNQVRELRVSAK